MTAQGENGRSPATVVSSRNRVVAGSVTLLPHVASAKVSND